MVDKRVSFKLRNGTNKSLTSHNRRLGMHRRWSDLNIARNQFPKHILANYEAIQRNDREDQSIVSFNLAKNMFDKRSPKS